MAAAKSNELADKLDVYAGLGVPEVWIWRNEGLEVWRLAAGGKGYDRHERSVLLPGIDLDALIRFLFWPNHAAAVRAYRDTLRARPA